jgi:acyl-CoA synthetase (AMP-forming)/AMP-acid ligase II
MSFEFQKPLKELTVGDYLDHHAANFPDRSALRTMTSGMSYGEVAVQVEQVSRVMHAMGLRTGDRVAVLSPPRLEAFITFLAAAKLGLIWLGLNPKYQLPEFQYIVDDARPTVLFGVDGFESRSYESELKSLRQSSIRRFIGFGEGKHYDEDFERWKQSHADCHEESYPAAVRSVTSDLPALLVYTSGSSGRPKGVLLGHLALLERSRTQNKQFPADPFPKVVNPFPINHIGGMHFVSFYAFVGGGTLFYIDKYDPDAIVELLVRRELNVIITIPTMLHLLMVNPRFKPELLDSLQWLYFSGAAMPKDLMEMLFRLELGVGLTYGMTETSGSVTYCKADRAHNNFEEMTATVGRPGPDGEVRVVSAGGDVCGPGESGEIQVRAQYCMSGYFQRDDATRAAFTEDGWMKTGDLAKVRRDGCLEFAGRSSEMFKSGGYNVYPREIEMALEKHPDVALAAVVAKEDSVYGEVGYAYVIARTNAAIKDVQLADWCRTQLANYKIPKRFVIAKELPLLPVGKVDKVTLRRMANEEVSSVS